MSSRLPLGEFLDALRGQGFTIATDHHIRVQQLVEGLEGRFDPARLKTLLCPLVATSEDQQQKFYQLFERWFPRFEQRAVEQQRGEVAMGEPAPAPTGRPTRRAAVWGVATLISAVAVAVLVPRLHKPPPVTNGGGQTTRPPGQIPLPPSQRETFTPSVAINVSALPAPPPNPLRRTALAFPAALLVLYLLYDWQRRRSAVLKRRAPPKPARLWPVRSERVSLEIQDRARFYLAARQLRRRQASDVEVLDVPTTIAATGRALGFLSLRYKSLTRRPEYVVLVDRRSRRDHQAALFEQLAAALKDDGLVLSTWFYAGDPRVCTSAKDGHSVFLIDLHQKTAGHRLILLTDGAGLIDSVHGDWTGAAQLLFPWRERALLTPKAAAEWGPWEEFLAREFYVLPATVDGLRALANGFEPASRKRRVEGGRERPAPELETVRRPGDVARYGDDLRGYLGPRLFDWFCACALYPHLQWDLTVRLGRRLFPERMDETNLLRLFRLPWYRRGSMPLDLEDHLASRLEPGLRARAHAAILEFLEESAPESGADDPAHRLELVVQRWGLRPRERAEVLDDDVLVHLAGVAPQSRLALWLPEKLRRALFQRGLPVFGLRPASLGLLVTLAAASLGVLAKDVILPKTATLETKFIPPRPPCQAGAGGLDLCTLDGWTPDYGEITPPCHPPNPHETSFEPVLLGLRPGVQLRTASNDMQCCTCTRRSKRFPMGRVFDTSRTVLRGWFEASRGPNDPYSVASAQVDLLFRGTRVASAVFAAENRPNNNCAGSSQRPERLLKNGSDFSVPLSSLKSAGEFDEVELHLQGYGCGPATNAVILADVRVEEEVGYVWIPPGTFGMGCSPGDNRCADDEMPPRRVTLTKGFWMGQTEVTVGAYKRFAQATGRSLPSGSDDYPVVNVTWQDATAFCQWGGGRLPTEAEWEGAARGTGQESSRLEDVAWFRDNSGGQSHPVAKKVPNGHGLYDMLGNVWEWCADWYQADYYKKKPPSTDPPGPSSGLGRVVRGGSRFVVARFARVSYRYWDGPGHRAGSVGFRCVREVIP